MPGYGRAGGGGTHGAELVAMTGSKRAAGLIARIGGPGSYSDKAAKEIFGKSAKMLICKSIFECLEATRNGKTKQALVPVYNTIIKDIVDGGQKVKDMAYEMGLVKESEHRLRIRLVLASYGNMAQIRVVYSKQQPIEQCGNFFKTHSYLHAADMIDGKKITDTSAAAEYVKSQKVRYAAAICDADAASHHKVPVILTDVADKRMNFTTFFVYARPGRPL